MSDVKDNDEKKLSLGGSRPTLQLKKPSVETGQVRQSFSHGRSKPVLVEHKRKRMVEPGHGAPAPAPVAAAAPAAAPAAPRPVAPAAPAASTPIASGAVASSAPVVNAPAPQPAPKPDAPQPVAVEAAPAPVAAAPAETEANRPARAESGLPRIIEASAPVVRPKILGEAPVRRPEAAATPAPQATGPRPSPNQGAPATVIRSGQNGRGATQTRSAQPAPTGRGPQPAAPAAPPRPSAQAQTKGRVVLRTLTDEEKATRSRALEGARVAEERARQLAEIDAKRRLIDDARQAEERAAAERRQQEEDARRKTDEDARRKAEAEAARRLESEPGAAGRPAAATTTADATAARPATSRGPGSLPRVLDDDDRPRPKRPGVGGPLKVAPKAAAPKPTPRGDDKRRSGRVNVTAAMEGGDERQRSLASMRRRIEREKRQMRGMEEKVKIVRDVVVPEIITVQELANRMAERGADVIKQLMRLGVMATINQSIDADTAELVVQEFGHRFKRVSDSDVEIGLEGEVDHDDHLEPRAPVVTVMGHVDHGKTSLLDALRATDVAAGEAGGITQHIGAYQVKLSTGQKITFLDTPGHEAFTAMRARGAKATDIVVLVVAADDGIMPQTIEAIRHARAANVPMVVAINKIDKPDANPNKVRQALLQHEVIVEELGGEVQAIEVSAKSRVGLDKLEEAILLQAEILELRANPDRDAAGVVIEAKLDRGRGPVATVLVQKGTLKIGDIFVAGGEWGKVRALIDDHGKQRPSAGPSEPVEVLGLTGAPAAGDEFQVVESEVRAREVTAFRQRRTKEQRGVTVARASLEQMFSKIKEGQAKELPIVIKADVQGSLEAIIGSLTKMGTDEVVVRILHDAVGGITESDVTLAKASSAPIIAFNVRANKQARDMAEHEGVEIRYYSIIYDLVDDIKAALSGLLAPTLKETFLGNAQIREVFNITKTGKVAGCLVTEGLVKRGAKVRLIRDNVVIHEGTLSTLRRFKDEVKEVKSGFECGMAFENYEGIQIGDVIEAFEIEEVARTL